MNKLFAVLAVLAMPAVAQELDYDKLMFIAVTDESAVALKNYMAKADADIRAVGDKVIAEVCSNRAEYDFDPEKFAAKVAKWQSDEKAIQARYVADLDKALNSNDLARVQQSASRLPKAKGIDTSDAPDRIRDGTIDLKEALDKTCEGAKQ